MSDQWQIEPIVLDPVFAEMLEFLRMVDLLWWGQVRDLGIPKTMLETIAGPDNGSKGHR